MAEDEGGKGNEVKPIHMEVILNVFLEHKSTKGYFVHNSVYCYSHSIKNYMSKR